MNAGCFPPLVHSGVHWKVKREDEHTFVTLFAHVSFAQQTIHIVALVAFMPLERQMHGVPHILVDAARNVT